MSNYIPHLSEINLKSVLLKDETGDVLINLAEETVAGKLSMGIIDIVESIATTSIRGELIVDSTRGEFEALQLIGNEIIQFVFSSPPAEDSEDGEDISILSPDFKLYDYNDSSDFTDTSKTPEGFKSRSLTLKFTSKQEGEVFDTETPLPYGFVGKIAVDPVIATATEDEFEGPPAPGEEDEEEVEVFPGLINQLAAKYFEGEPFEIEPTDNSVFVSPKRFTYPHKKPTKSANLLQLMKYCTNYAWKGSDEGVAGPPAPTDDVETYNKYGWSNYFLWQDLYGWHFKSAEAMSSDSLSKGIKKFTLSSNILDKTRILKMDPISDFSIKKAFSTGMLYSYLTRTELNFSDVYSRFLDDDEKYVRTNYTFNYAKDHVPLVEPFKFLPNTLENKAIDVWISDKANDELEVKDYLFGWYDNRQFNNKEEIYRLIGSGRDKNAKGPLGNTGEESVTNNTLNNRADLVDYISYQDNLWQEQFDCVKVGDPADLDEDCRNLTKLVKIKADTFNAKKAYKSAMSYKERWNLYRYSVCCEVPETNNNNERLAILKGHKKMAGASNVFEYEWAEVCIIPKAAIGFLVGHKIEDYGGINPWDNNLVGTAGLNALDFIDKCDTGILKVYPYVADASEASGPRMGYVSGIVHFGSMDPGSTAEGVTGSISWDNVKDLFDDIGGVSADGLTLTFHNSQYSPFLVVEKVKGESGALPGNKAYNLNEIMNRPILDEDEYEVVAGLCAGPSGGARPTIFYQDAPDFSGDGANEDPFEGAGRNMRNVQYMVGPGINASDSDAKIGGADANDVDVWTEYPGDFDTMPIGSYKTVRRNSDGSYLGSLECEAIPLGHVVKMEFASFDEIYKLGIEGRHDDPEAPSGYNKGPRGIYYFSAENAHDGKCSGEGCII